MKLPFKLDTLEADRHFIPIYPDNKQWLVVLRGTELGDKLCGLLETEEKSVVGSSSSVVGENYEPQTTNYGLYLDKIYGLYQEERQLLERQIEDYYNETLSYQKFIAKIAKVLNLANDDVIELLDDPYKKGLEQGEKLEPFLADFREAAKKLIKLESRLNEDAIAVVMRKRFKIDWSKEETEMLHEGMKKALSDFISNEQKGWEEKSELKSQKSEGEEEVGEDIESQTGVLSTTT